jgi:NCAIR mutase (PurE)-related protein
LVWFLFFTQALQNFIPIGKSGAAEIQAAKEARVIASEMGCKTIAVYDVGVAGIHRLIPELQRLKAMKPEAIVVAAGGEGALLSIVSGLVDVPVIGLPVYTGYGTGGKGKAALLAMLQSCSPIAVVNIDVGFVAGAYAAWIANMIATAIKLNIGEKNRAERRGTKRRRDQKLLKNAM